MDEEAIDLLPPSVVGGRPPAARRYLYKMIQVPVDLDIYEGTPIKERASSYLEEVVNEVAEEGWEFFRIDEFRIRVNPGCLSMIFGVFLGDQTKTVVRNVITFRKPA